MTLAASELGLHPLAVQDAQHQRQRPKIDECEDHYFIVAYALEEPNSDEIVRREPSIFVEAQRDRHRARRVARGAPAPRRTLPQGNLETTGLLLHAILDTIVDAYFDVLDGPGDRVERLEAMVIEGDSHDANASIRELFKLKGDLLAIRKVNAPEREVAVDPLPLINIPALCPRLVPVTLLLHCPNGVLGALAPISSRWGSR